MFVAGVFTKPLKGNVKVSVSDSSLGPLVAEVKELRGGAEMGLFYARFMDDWVTRSAAPTRWKLRRAIKAVNQTLAELKAEKLPDKTFIGRIERGFDFLG